MNSNQEEPPPLDNGNPEQTNPQQCNRIQFSKEVKEVIDKVSFFFKKWKRGEEF